MRRTDGGDLALVRSDLAAVPLAEFWQDGVPLDGALGRGGVRIARIAGLDVALRDYKRGGALRRLLPDLFLSEQRAFGELAVTAALRARGVAVVESVAALARRRGPFRSLRLATLLVRDALPLPSFVAARTDLRREALRRAGAVVAQAFSAGLDHRDLHPANLIARAASGGAVEVVLLDLDRAELVDALSLARRDAMLVRMARWLRRHQRELGVTVRARDFTEFLRGMGMERTARRVAWERMARKLRWSLAWRGMGVAQCATSCG